MFQKVCKHCHKPFESESRNTRYCSDSCAKKRQAYIKSSRKRYREIAPVERVRVAAHTLAVRVCQLEIEMNIRKSGCACCGATENLQCHHKDLNWLNNSPSNLVMLCNSCHSKTHSEIQKKMDSLGLSGVEMYPEDVQWFAEIINKDK